MSEQYRASVLSFDYNSPANELAPRASSIADDVLKLTSIAIRFALIERVPRYTPETRENDAEHSYMLGLVCQEIASQYFPDLDAGLVVQMALVHDLLELKTGDIATFQLTKEELLEKEEAEQAALDTLCSELPLFTAELLREYESQTLPEARFVRFMDKHLPVAVNIHGTGTQVMREDYATFTTEQLIIAENALKVRFLKMFPDEELEALHEARDLLANLFSESFVSADCLQDTLF